VDRAAQPKPVDKNFQQRTLPLLHHLALRVCNNILPCFFFSRVPVDSSRPKATEYGVGAHGANQPQTSVQTERNALERMEHLLHRTQRVYTYGEISVRR
jgi:hypothetical protein